MKSNIRLLTYQKIWPRLSELAAVKPGYVAVPYIGKGATAMLPLQPGSVLVTRFEKSAAQAGQVCPEEIIGWLKAGVRVFNEPALHAKVYVFGEHAIIGSSNVSKTSCERLKEACVETKDVTTVNAARKFVERLMLDEVDVEWARAMKRFYREPKAYPMASKQGGKANRQYPRNDHFAERPLWLMPTYPVKRTSSALERAGELAERSAATRIVDSSTVDVETFYCRERHRKHFEVGDIALVRYRDAGAGIDEIQPPGKIVAIRKVHRGKSFAVSVARKARARVRKTEVLVKRLGTKADGLMKLKYAVGRASSEDREALLRLWVFDEDADVRLRKG